MRRNVLHLVPSFRQGGSESQAVQLAGWLRREGTYDVSVACLDGEGVLLERARDFGFTQIEEFPLTSFYDRNMASQLRRFVRFLNEKKPSLVQTHDFYTNIFGMLGARLARVPVRVAAKRETGMRTKMQLFTERRAFDLSTKIVANSEMVRRYLTHGGVNRSKIEVIHNGIDLDPFADAAVNKICPRKLGIDNACSQRMVTIVANLRSTVKNHEMFLKGAAAVAGRFTDVGFVVAGEGELTEGYQRLATELGIRERVHFIGRCKDVPALLACSTVCVLTSDTEGFSNSIIEYMAAGRPVVATQVGGASEAIVDLETGFLIPVKDHDSLSARLCELLADDELSKRMGQKGRERAGVLFSAEAQLEKTLELYEREFARHA